MEAYNKNTGPVIEKKPETPSESNWGGGRAWAGLLVIAVGSIWLAREAGADIPRWVTSWPMFLVAVGLFVGIKSNFKNWGWIIPTGIGIAFLVDRIFWDINIRPFIAPAVIVVIGLFILFRPRGKQDDVWSNWAKANPDWDKSPVNPTSEDSIDSVAVFGSVRKNILSKNFRGGSTVSFLGGTELNLTQADMTQPIVLDMTQVFGGAKLIVPSNWTIHSAELVSVFGGVEDKRMIAANVDPNKILKLTGVSVFGGLEIKSF